MESNQETDQTLVNKYETVFCVFMAVLAYLWRDNPNIIYPKVLYLFLLLLAFNLGAGLSLRLWPTREWISAMFILANCGTITSVLNYSGGAESNLWVLYLLPIYTVCLLLGLREVVWITTGAIGFNAVFLAFEVANWSAESTFELMLKSSIFIFTAAVTRRIVERDRSTKRKLTAKRMEIKNLEELLQNQKARLEANEKMADVRSTSSKVTHDLNNMFTAILGFADIALQGESLTPETKGDLQSIRRILIRCKDLVANFVASAKLSDPKLKRSGDLPIEFTRSTLHQARMRDSGRTV